MKRNTLKLIFTLLLLHTGANAEQNNYPYWGTYTKTPMWDVVAPKWIDKDNTIEGWDWSLPTNTKASPKGYICLARIMNIQEVKQIDKIKPVNFESNTIVELWVNWREIEAVEGVFDFTLLKKRIDAELFQNTLGQINLQSLQDPFEISMMLSGQQPLVYKNWKITVPENPVVAAADFLTRLAGAYWPVSLIPGDYFNDNN
jgi:hypothetical protein